MSNKTCPNCSTENEANEEYCGACGSKFAVVIESVDSASAAAVATAPAGQSVGQAVQSTDVAPQQPIQNLPPVAVLKYNGIEYPVKPGSSTSMANANSDKCTPDIPIVDDKSSSTPVELICDDNGNMFVKDNGTTNGTRVVVILRPGESMPISKGCTIILGQSGIVAIS